MQDSDLFDLHTDAYEAWFERHEAVYRSEIEAIRCLMPASGRGLEIGVGSGLFSAPLGIREGIDPSPAMLERAAKRGIAVTRGVAEHLPYPDQVFDLALMVTAVCFLDDIDLAFSEAHRVLRQGGLFLIGFVDRTSPIGRAYEAGKAKSLFYKDAVFYDTNELTDHLSRAGFSSFQYRQTLFKPLEAVQQPEPSRPGFGEGSFVVIRAERAG
jgi:SAM-dependent methyltransferase